MLHHPHTPTSYLLPRRYALVASSSPTLARIPDSLIISDVDACLRQQTLLDIPTTTSDSITTRAPSSLSLLCKTLCRLPASRTFSKRTATRTSLTYALLRLASSLHYARSILTDSAACPVIPPLLLSYLRYEQLGSRAAHFCSISRE